MSVRVQVILSLEEKTRLQQEARRAGMSLSAWIRQAALERPEAESQDLGSPSHLHAFFAACDEREGEEREPDWAQHLEVIAESRRRGRSEP